MQYVLKSKRLASHTVLCTYIYCIYIVCWLKFDFASLKFKLLVWVRERKLRTFAVIRQIALLFLGIDSVVKAWGVFGVFRNSEQKWRYWNETPSEGGVRRSCFYSTLVIFKFTLEARGGRVRTGCNVALWPQGGSREPWVVEREDGA